MTAFRLTLEPSTVKLEVGADLLLRSPELEDFAQWVQLRATSRAFLEPWEPIWPDDDLTKPAFRRRIQRYNRERQNDLGCAFFIFQTSSNKLVGGVNIANIQRGVAQMATIGYWMGEHFSRQGLMSEALKAAVNYGFDRLKLERISAGVLQHNEASLRLLKKTGFLEEGLARSYLRIAGKRQDHVLFAMLAEDR